MVADENLSTFPTWIFGSLEIVYILDSGTHEFLVPVWLYSGQTSLMKKKKLADESSLTGIIFALAISACGGNITCVFSG